MNSKELLSITTILGSELIKNGAEIYRVEESISRIAAAYGFDEENSSVEVFAIPSTLIVTVEANNSNPLTRQKQIKERHTNLDMVDKLNDLSRFICKKKPNYATFLKMIHAIQKNKTYSFPLILLSYAVISSSYALLFGGSFREAFVGALIAITIKLVANIISKVRPSIFFESLICSMIVAALAVFVYWTGFIDAYDSVIIGSLMPLVPGIILTNCMRDFIAGDFLAGIYTLTEGLLIACGMAIGVATSISVMTTILGV